MGSRVGRVGHLPRQLVVEEMLSGHFADNRQSQNETCLHLKKKSCKRAVEIQRDSLIIVYTGDDTAANGDGHRHEETGDLVAALHRCRTAQSVVEVGDVVMQFLVLWSSLQRNTGGKLPVQTVRYIKAQVNC